MSSQTKKLGLVAIFVILTIITGCMGGESKKYYKLTVTVLDKVTETALPGAKVEIVGVTSNEKTTNDRGNVVFDNLSGVYELSVQKAGYTDDSTNKVTMNKDQELTIKMKPNDIYGTIFGEIVTAESGKKVLQSAEVKLDSGEEQIVENGEFLFSNLTPGSRKLTVTSVGYEPYEKNVEIVAGINSTVLIELKEEKVGYGGLEGQFLHMISEEPLPGDGIQVFLNGEAGIVDETGYRFENFPAGYWDLEVVAPDYEPRSLPSIQIIADKTRTYNIKLHPRIIPPFPPEEVLVPYIADYPAGNLPVEINSFYMSAYTVTAELAKVVYEWAISEERGADKYYFSRELYDHYIPSEKLLLPSILCWRDAIVWCNALTEYSNAIENTDLTCVYTYENQIIRDSRAENAFACNFATAEDTTGYRLPTVLEWEAAARYQDGQNWTPRDHASGDLSAPCYPSNGENVSTEYGDYAWHSGNSNSVAQLVGQKKPNHLDIYDMSGNVWEFCFDQYEEDASKRTLKGGSAMRTDVHIDATMYPDSGKSMPEYGFRLVRTY